LLALVLKQDQARTRHAIWLAASVKFLIPFALLVAAGNHLQWHKVSATPARFSVAIEQISQPFPSLPGGPLAAQSPRPSGRIVPVITAIWLCGSLALIVFWFARWFRVRQAVRAASRFHGLPIAAVLSSACLEPGVFGIFKPVLLLPAGIEERLTADQMQAIVAHELCHVRRRDNLAALIHMAVETIFWFHPLVWWLGARLLEERERACDEEVVRLGSNRQVYAEGILNVCKFYLESPVECVSGVTGSNLRARIEAIMSNRIARQLTRGRKMLLASAGIAALVAPLVIGILGAPQVRAQQTDAAPPAGTPAFEVASIKPNDSKDFRMMLPQIRPGGTLAFRNMPVYLIVTQAYDLPFSSPQRVSGGPAWMTSERFDIDAKPGPGAIPAGLSEAKRNEKVMLMIQLLLKDRFKMKAHWETRELPVYALTVAKNGIRLQPAKVEEKDCPELSGPEQNCHMFQGGQGQGVHGKTVSMSDLVTGLENFTDRALIDRTDFKGLFDIDTEGWVPMRPRPGPVPGTEPSAEDRAFADPARPTLQQVLDKVGIRMESTKGPVQVLVIDHIERPSEN